MKNKILIGLIIFAISGVVALNLDFSTLKKKHWSNLTLSGLEKLAFGEECGEDSGGCGEEEGEEGGGELITTEEVIDIDPGYDEDDSYDDPEEPGFGEPRRRCCQKTRTVQETGIINNRIVVEVTRTYYRCKRGEPNSPCYLGFKAIGYDLNGTVNEDNTYAKEEC